jgi:DNA helicase II / ATP-dependent DNA helicase PcrA
VDAGQQAAFIAQRALELRDEGVSLNQIAVLYRSHFHALELQLELTRRRSPSPSPAASAFLSRRTSRTRRRILKFTANPRDEISFKRLAQLLPGIAAKGADKLWQQFFGDSPKIQDWQRRRRDGRQHPSPTRAPAISIAPLAGHARNPCPKRPPWLGAIRRHHFAAGGRAVRKSAAKMLRLVMDAGYDDYLKETYDNYERRLDELQQLAEFAFQFGSVEEFLTQLALLTNVEAEDDRRRRTTRKNPALDHSSGQGTGVRRGVCDHALRRAVSVGALGGEQRRRGGGAAAVLRGHHAREE